MKVQDYFIAIFNITTQNMLKLGMKSSITLYDHIKYKKYFKIWYPVCVHLKENKIQDLSELKN